MMQIGIYGRLLELGKASYIQKLVGLLEENKCRIHIYEPFLPHIQNKIQWKNQPLTFKTIKEVQPNLDVLIGIGGDGTILDTVNIVGDSGIPVLGINLGRLGFLATIGVEDIESAVQAIINNYFEIDERALISVEANAEVFHSKIYALNEFTLHKKDTSSMVIIHAYLNGEFLNTYWADGIIVSTPTGSTGYNLSCGGPVIMPNSKSLVICPVAPHNLNIRPLVVSDDSVLSFEIEGRANQFLCTLDSRYETVDANIQIAVKRAKHNFRLIRMPDTNFLNSLRSKLLWGSDKRTSYKSKTNFE